MYKNVQTPIKAVFSPFERIGGLEVSQYLLSHIDVLICVYV